MKKILNLLTFGLLLFSFHALISCSDSDDSTNKDGLTEQSWSSSRKINVSIGDIVTLSFNAASNWEVQNNAKKLLNLSKTSGVSGKNTLEVKIEDSSLEQGSILIKVEGYSSTTEITFIVSDDSSKDYAVNVITDRYLKQYYLWNEDYKKLEPNFYQPYDDFLQNTLLSMTTNVLDKKPTGNTSNPYALFSFMKKVDKSLQTRAASLKKSLTYSYGFINFLALQTTSTSVELVVQGVTVGSSCYATGLLRNTHITEINDEKITIANWKDLYIRLMQPFAASTIKIKDSNNKIYTINSGPIYVNPIIDSNITNVIGYLAYSAFDASYDEELFNEFKKFKEANITNLILDLRYNGGGHVMSAKLMASCIAGSLCENKDFARYRYNDERMQKDFNNVMPSEKFAYSHYDNLNSSLAAGALNLTKVYCLVSSNSASASELVINSLRGIGVEVVLIGTQTHGKNVGMEGFEFSEGNDKYELYPITFQVYNELGFGDYQNGFTPNYLIDENKPTGQYFQGYGVLGTTSDPLYAQALKLITGKGTVQTSKRTTESTPKTKILETPDVYFMNMIKY